MNNITPPEGYRLMNVGEFPKDGDLVYSINSDPKWSRTTMTGTWRIYSVPSNESLIYARKTVE